MSNNKMYCKRGLPNNSNSEPTEAIICNHKLSDGAYRLYGYMLSLSNGIMFNEEFLANTLNVQLRTIQNRRRELEDLNLIVLDKKTPKNIDIYLSDEGMTPQEVRAVWTKLSLSSVLV